MARPESAADPAEALLAAIHLVRACRVDAVGVGQLDRLVVLVRDGERALAHLLVELGGRADRLAAEGVGPGAGELLVGRGEVSAHRARHEAARTRLVEALPGLGSALAAGEIGGEHLDAVARAERRLTEPEVAAFRQAEPQIVAAASGRPVDTFKRWLGRRIGRIRDEHRGPEGADAAEEPPTVRAWRGRNGRGHLSLDVDPVLFDVLLGIIAQAPAAGAEGEPAPDGSAAAPADHAVAAARWLLDRLLNPGAAGASTGPAGPRADVIVIIDGATAFGGRHAGTLCETSHGTPVPVATASRFACQAALRRVVFGPGGVPIDVGRRYRTATAAQWAVIKALHRTCAWYGCDRTVEWCQAHHIDPWDPTGRTDLANLVPLCSRHHHLVHEGGWRIELLADRSLELFTPDGHHWRTSHPDRLEDWLRAGASDLRAGVG